MRLNVRYEFLPKQRSLNTSFVMDHFGIDFEQGEHVIAEDLELDLRPGDVTFFTGPSGSGKSSLLRAAAEQLDPATVLWIDRLAMPETPLVDAMPLPIKESLDLLAACGLGEAQLLLRSPSELSDGQRYRFRLALGIALLTHHSSLKTHHSLWLVADEFSAALDRTLAKVLAFNIRRLARRTGVGFLLATTHDDLLADLDPDVLVRCDLDGRITVERGVRNSERGAEDSEASSALRAPSSALPRRAVSFFASSGSARAPNPIGRTSRGGIIAATGCA